MSEEKLPEYFHQVSSNMLTVYKRREDATPEMIYQVNLEETYIAGAS